MVLNDIIEQAAGRHSGASEHGGKSFFFFLTNYWLNDLGVTKIN